jgi:signal transduction histidine kinase
MSQLRRILSDVRPLEVDATNLARTLAELLQAFELQHPDVKLQMTGDGLASLQQGGALVATAAYGIIREAVRNALKHGAPSAIVVHLAGHGQAVEIRVHDDGRGFDPAAPSKPGEEGGYGLIGMRDRARLVGGTLRIVSAPGAGTTIRALLLARTAHSTPLASGEDGRP